MAPFSSLLVAMLDMSITQNEISDELIGEK